MTAIAITIVTNTTIDEDFCHYCYYFSCCYYYYAYYEYYCLHDYLP